MIVCPGDTLEADGGAHLAGSGAYFDESPKGSVIRASVTGVVSVEVVEGSKKQYSVVPRSAGGDMKLDVNDYVLAQATKVMQHQVAVQIVVAGDVKLRLAAKGMIRREDMQVSETDTLVMTNCFRPGDIIRCKVLSLGDRRQYFLGTAEKSCGVVYAKSATSQELMVPVKSGSETYMLDETTQIKELRIVAQTE